MDKRNKRRVLSTVLASLSLGAFSTTSGHNDKKYGSRSRSKSQFSRKSTQSTKIGSDFNLNVKNAKRPSSSSVGEMNRNFKNKNVKNGLNGIDSAAVKNMNLSNIGLSKGDSSSNWWNNLSTAGKVGTVGGGTFGIGAAGTGIYFLTRFLMQKFGKCDFIKYMRIHNDSSGVMRGSDVSVSYDYINKKNYKFCNIKFYLVTNGKKGAQNRKFYLISKIECPLESKKGVVEKEPDKLRLKNNDNYDFDDSLCYEIEKDSLHNFDNTKERKLFEESAYKLANMLVLNLVMGKKMKDSSKLYKDTDGYGVLKNYAKTFILDNTMIKDSNKVRFYVLSDEKIKLIEKEERFFVEEINVND